MKPVLWISALCAITLALFSCENFGPGVGRGPTRGNQQSGVGPFDENGNYIEAWADNPAKWRRSGKNPSPHELKSDEIPVIAKSEQPPQNSIPLISVSQYKSRISASAKSKSKAVSEKIVRVSARSKIKTKPTPLAAKSKTRTQSTSTSVKAKSKVQAKPLASKAKPKISSTSSQTTKVKAKPTPAAGPTKAKIKSTKRVVKKDE